MLVDKNYGVSFGRVLNSLSHTNSEKEKVWFVHHYERLVTWLKTSSCKVVAGKAGGIVVPGVTFLAAESPRKATAAAPTPKNANAC